MVKWKGKGYRNGVMEGTGSGRKGLLDRKGRGREEGRRDRIHELYGKISLFECGILFCFVMRL